MKKKKTHCKKTTTTHLQKLHNETGCKKKKQDAKKKQQTRCKKTHNKTRCKKYTTKHAAKNIQQNTLQKIYNKTKHNRTLAKKKKKKTLQSHAICQKIAHSRGAALRKGEGCSCTLPSSPPCGVSAFRVQLHLPSAVLLRAGVLIWACASGIAAISSPACQSFDFPPVRLVIETGPEPGGAVAVCFYANAQTVHAFTWVFVSICGVPALAWLGCFL